MRFGFLALAVLALLAAGCSGGADDADVITTDAVSVALAGTVEAPVYRVTTSSIQWLTTRGMGADADPQQMGSARTVVATVGRDREYQVHSVVPEPGSQFAGGDPFKIEIWSDGERLVMDTRDHQRLVDAVPDIDDIDMGPLEPGLFFVDLAALGSRHPEFLDVLVGVSSPSLRDLAENLPAALDTIEQTSEDPPTYVGSTTVASLYRAQGADVADAIRTAIAAVALVAPVNIDELTGLLSEAYNTARAEVVIELDDQGFLSVLLTREDHSGIFSAMLRAESMDAIVSDRERGEAREALEGAELIAETRSVYETDVELEIPLPPAATEDRTDEWREYLINAGFDR